MGFENDKLERILFADRLIGFSKVLSTAPILPAGRVIAVDAPWGTGKSWIAQQLPTYFSSSSDIGATIYIDAFEFDFHNDPFVVVTSAIIDECKKQTKAIKSFKTAASGVIQVSLPAIGKSLVKAGAKAVGLNEDVISDIVSGVADASEKSIEKMLTTFSNTKATTEKFKEQLTNLANAYGENKPLIIIIDELDRCRPSFALEMLERIKHLFDVKNVVFILFMHKLALHSAINKTYGASINAEEYLKKFISLTIGLPDSRKANPTKDDLSNFIRQFLDVQFPVPPEGLTSSGHDFRDAVIELAPYFKTSLRDIQQVMLLWQLTKGNVRINNYDLVYALLLKVMDKNQLEKLQSGNKNAYQKEIGRLTDNSRNENWNIKTYRESFNFAVHSNENSKDDADRVNIQNYKRTIEYFTNALNSLNLEYFKLN